MLLHTPRKQNISPTWPEPFQGELPSAPTVSSISSLSTNIANETWRGSTPHLGSQSPPGWRRRLHFLGTLGNPNRTVQPSFCDKPASWLGGVDPQHDRIPWFFSKTSPLLDVKLWIHPTQSCVFSFNQRRLSENSWLTNWATWNLADMNH